MLAGVTTKDPPEAALVQDGEHAVAEADELPVVARLVVEIRSDGTRTVARGAMSDVETGQAVAVELQSGSPWQMAQSLVKALLGMPKLVLKTRKAIARTRG
jgi:hypothetical protein